ncbi:ABC transporter permease [Paenibacillus puerhi]|uniref:ABC transporter permease n=1 Tax=Paenibacillus puerhi TaxID=2692622 RepID=UPI0013570782|nr:ABC-2 family transporter protein [Paenibacillus puerhi]
MKAYQKYNHVFKLGFQSALEYRMDFLFSLAAAFFPIMIQYYIWSAVYGKSDSSQFFGYSYKEMILYTIIAAVVTRIVMTNVDHEMATDIKDGNLNKYLVQPLHYFSFRIFNLFGQKLFFYSVMIVVIFFVLIFFTLYYGTPLQFQRISLFFITIFLAFLLNFMISYTISAIAFWLSEISFFFEMTGLLVIIISGGMFPIDVFGPTMNAILTYLPFKFTIYFPTNVINGKLDMGEILQGIGWQCFWIVVMYLVSRVVWNRGMKRYLGLGG